MVRAQPDSPPTNGLVFLLTEMSRRGLRVFAEKKEDGIHWKVQGNHPLSAENPEENWGDQWEGLAGSLVDAIKQSSLLFVWGVAGLLSKHEYLTCNACGETQLCSRKDGAPSANKKCAMTVKCEGKMKRLPNYPFVMDKGDVPVSIRREALEMYDGIGNMAEVARQMTLKYPDFKFSGTGIKAWRRQREGGSSGGFG